jgi:hypothetical protein
MAAVITGYVKFFSPLGVMEKIIGWPVLPGESDKFIGSRDRLKKCP